jgi:hypothetical protein
MLRHYRGVFVVSVLACTVAFAHVAGAAPDPAKCPSGVASAASTVQWVWSALGAPSSGDPSVTSSRTRGNGTWNNGRAHGTICSQAKGGGSATRNIVLTVGGASKLSPNITKLGLPGIGLVLPVTVSASDDSACPDGTTGSVTLFASYHAVHKDKAVLAFAAACSTHDDTFTGSILHVEIARDGHQVTST